MKYSFITATHDFETYQKNVEASLPLENDRFELIPVDNRNGRFNVPQALNYGRNQAQGELIIFCHHDVVFPPGWLNTLESQLDKIGDPQWGVIGLMGVRSNGKFAGHISDPHTSYRIGKLPCEVDSLDEVCLILRNASPFSFDEELGGYHFYGADLCLQNRFAGLKCYSIDASLTHLSAGNVDKQFSRMAEKLKKKWSSIPNSPHSIETTCGVFALRNGILSKLAMFLKTIRRKILRRIQRSSRFDTV